MGRFLEKAVIACRSHHLRLLVAARCLIGAALFVAATSHAHAQVLADGIAAVVNDKVITYVQINQAVADTEKLLRQNYQGEELFQRLKEAKLNVLNALIER